MLAKREFAPQQPAQPAAQRALSALQTRCRGRRIWMKQLRPTPTELIARLRLNQLSPKRFARDAVAISVHVSPVAWLSAPQRSSASSARFTTVSIAPV